MTLETAAKWNLRLRQLGLLAGIPAGLAIGFAGAVLVGKALPDGGSSAWALLVVVPLFAGIPLALLACAYAAEWIASLVTAACPAPDCGGRVHVLRRRVFRCSRCGREFRSDADAGTEFESIARRSEARIEEGLASKERGSVSVSEPSKAGALTEKTPS